MIFWLKDYLKKRSWKKKYNMKYPVWADYDILDSRVYSDPTFHEWLSKLNAEQKEEFGMKMQIVSSELDRLAISIDNEIIKRGGEPDKE